MGGRGRVLLFLALNVVISALTTMLVINLWLRNSLTPEAPAAPTTAVAESGGSDATGDTGDVAPPTATTAPANVTGEMEIVTIIGPGDYTNERLQVRYNGADELSLSGWQLFDEDGNTFVFPALTMYSGGAVTVYTAAGLDTVVEMYWGLSEPIWTSGETATLVDQGGAVQATYTIP